MRALLATSLGALSTAALLLPLPPATAAAAGEADPPVRAAAPVPRLPGSTQSLPLAPLPVPDGAGTSGGSGTTDRSGGSGPARAGNGAGGEVGLAPHAVRPFSLVGVVWQDADAELDGHAQVRTRAAGTGTWSGWQELATHTEHAEQPASRGRAARGATAPLWAGASDGVQVRVRAHHGAELPHGLSLELVDPGDGPGGDGPGGGPGHGPARHAGAAGPGRPAAQGRQQTQGAPSAEGTTAQRPPLVLPALDRARTVNAARAAGLGTADRAGAGPHIGPRPGIVTRRGWGADPGLREDGFRYARTVRMAFVHHTAMTNGYSCSKAPSVIRSIYRYHVRSSGWRDIGYNFLVDKCGTIYEGRAGGVTEPVRGAHTYGFNAGSMGIAVLGTYSSAEPSTAAVQAVAKLTAWKFGLYGVNPKGTARMTKGGRTHRLDTVSGHRDGYNTDCPGDRLYGELGSVRALAARLQGR